MAKFSTDSKTDIFTHIAIIIGSFLIIFLVFFFIYLPWSTNHGQSIAVPDLRGMTIEEMKTALDERDLDYEINDSIFNPSAKPLTILQQKPKAGLTVKEGRKIYLTVASASAPLVGLPDFEGMSLSSYKNQLLSYDITCDVEYVSDIATNTVLKVKYNGKEIKAKERIPKGAKVLLVVANGYGNEMVDIPNVVGMTYDEAKFAIEGLGLAITPIYEGPIENTVDGTVTKQKPAIEAGKVRTGQTIDVFIAGNAPSSN
jgi:eukaryotic-like serine/threonine-protein kinase